MQFAKDSFFLALQSRLAALNPARTVAISGATVPAIVVIENLPPTSGEPQADTFYIEWGEAEVLRGNAGSSALMSLDVVISYHSVGSVPSMVDRGRVLGQLDSELLAICQPGNTEKRDYTQSPSADLGTCVFWTQPTFSEVRSSGVADSTEGRQDARVERRARMKIYFFAEVSFSGALLLYVRQWFPCRDRCALILLR